MKVRCKCGQKFSMANPAQCKKIICPKCSAALQIGPPLAVGNFRLGKQLHSEDGLFIKAGRQGALQLEVQVVLFEQEKHPEVVVAAKRLAAAPFASAVKLLDMGAEEGWGYVALQAKTEPQHLADWFLRGASDGIKEPFLRRHRIGAALITIFILVLTTTLISTPSEKSATDMYSSEDWKTRRASLRLAEKSPDGVALLVTALGDKHYRVRIAACQELAKHRGREIEEALGRAMGDKAKSVRSAALKSLKAVAH